MLESTPFFTFYRNHHVPSRSACPGPRPQPVRLRTLKPDQMATMDFNDKRLNLDLDAAGVVTAVRCG